jgi:hypothetical protein
MVGNCNGADPITGRLLPEYLSVTVRVEMLLHFSAICNFFPIVKPESKKQN